MRYLKAEELKHVYGGTEDPPAKKKGDNGWGNGAEGTNAGSDEGGTAGSKSDELWETGDGPKPDKFSTR